MSPAATIDIGTIQAGEYDIKFNPNPPTPIKRTQPGVILWHGSQTPTQWTGSIGWPSCSQLVWRLVRAGIPCVTGDFGLETWGNATAMSRGDAALAELAAATGCSPYKAIHIGVSMGGLNALQYGCTNPTKTAAIVGIIPLCDLPGFYAANILGAQTAIAAAWGVTAPATLGPTADVLTRAATIKAAGIPTLLMNSAVDPYVTPASVDAMRAACGASGGVIDHASGHANGTAAQVNLHTLVNFLRAAGA